MEITATAKEKLVQEIEKLENKQNLHHRLHGCYCSQLATEIKNAKWEYFQKVGEEY